MFTLKFLQQTKDFLAAIPYMALSNLAFGALDVTARSPIRGFDSLKILHCLFGFSQVKDYSKVALCSFRAAGYLINSSKQT